MYRPGRASSFSCVEIPFAFRATGGGDNLFRSRARETGRGKPQRRRRAADDDDHSRPSEDAGAHKDDSFVSTENDKLLAAPRRTRNGPTTAALVRAVVGRAAAIRHRPTNAVE